MMFTVTKHGLTSMRIMRLACPGVVLVPAKVPAVERFPCTDPTCGTKTDAHTDDCSLAMNTPKMHQPTLPGAREGVW